MINIVQKSITEKENLILMDNMNYFCTEIKSMLCTVQNYLEERRNCAKSAHMYSDSFNTKHIMRGDESLSLILLDVMNSFEDFRS